MIKSLKIKNYALINDVKINFKEGFTVLGGETGAGKSIILDALSVLLGKRIDRFAIRSNKKTIIEGIFKLDNSFVNFFNQHNIDYEETTIITREVNSNGKSRAFINDTPVLLNILNDLGTQIVEIHTQNQSILLQDQVSQFTLIDLFCNTNEILSNYQLQYIKYKDLHTELIKIKASGSLSENELDFLNFQINELSLANLQVGEKEELETKIDFLENIQGISEVIKNGESTLNDEYGVISRLSLLEKRMLDYDTFNDLSKRINSVLIELNDLNDHLSSKSVNLNCDPSQLHNFNSRLDELNALLNKYRKNNESDLINYLNELQRKINLSKSYNNLLKDVGSKIEVQLNILSNLSTELNKIRCAALPSFEKEVETNLNNLGMPHARFKVELIECNDFHYYGKTEVKFLFSANKGASLLEVAKVASGGELSRLMLVMKYISAKSIGLNTLFFDEIDIGVSGEIASLMGNMMSEISNSSQVIAISHLPQVASKANQHLKVVKHIVNNRTVSDVKNLNNEERIMEIAKLLSGKEVSSEAYENAKVLLNQ
ncbi:MAG: DNA repair protein RecN [Flavobacteriales bacterium]|nr:DNA repair protein RecN [Flavobacteriales bacterium]|tara:strand:- start:5372 stop:7006 length:1635 start_codon:yes stop_codon:yes gene_type:complete